jgi:hypothetical protein
MERSISDLVNGAVVEERVQAIIASGAKIVVSATGAGLGLQGLIGSVGGASEVLLDAVTPYAQPALEDFIGHVPKKFCSREVALWMASAAHRRAQELAMRMGRLHDHFVGVGITGSIRTLKPKRGPHVVHIATRGSTGFKTLTVNFEKGLLSRAEEAKLTDVLGLEALFCAAARDDGGDMSPFMDGFGLHSEQCFEQTDGAARFITEKVGPLSLGEDELHGLPVFMPDGSRTRLANLNRDQCILFPGSFNPLQYGHERMALQCEQMTGKKVVFCITNKHPDKGVIPDNELLARAEQFRWRWPVAFTRGDALYIEKARQFSGFGFLIGADAALGILDAKYYGGVVGLEAALREFRCLRTKFHVVGRVCNGEFISPETLPVPPEFEKLFRPVTGRWDIHSSDLR